jgi:hypothetical protein
MVEDTPDGCSPSVHRGLLARSPARDEIIVGMEAVEADDVQPIAETCSPAT